MRIGGAWDHERFADDPRKTISVFSFEQENHLLLVFSQGICLLTDAARWG